MKDIYAPEYVKQLFNQMSASYERMNFITSFGFSILWRKQFIAQLSDSTKEIAVLDLLSGLGENWTLLRKKYPNASITALDFSEEMVRKSTLKNELHFDNKIDIIQENILQHHLGEQQFDLVFCAFGLKTFNPEQWERLAEILQRILAPQGQFSFIEISVPSNPFLKLFYQFYLSKVIPVLGRLFLGNPSDYKMLWTYTKQFNNSQNVNAIFKKHHLQTQYKRYFFGCASGVTGKKTAS